MENPSLGRKNHDMSLLYIFLIIKRIQGMEYLYTTMDFDKKGNKQGYKHYTNTLCTIIFNTIVLHFLFFRDKRQNLCWLSNMLSVFCI